MSNEIYLNMFGYILGFRFAGMLLAMSIHSPGIVIITIWPIIGIPAAMIVTWAVLATDHDVSKVSKIWLEIGETSYATYLTHPFVIGIFSILAKRSGFLDQFSAVSIIAIFSIVVMLSSLLCGYIAHYIIDLPITRYFSKLWPAPKTSHAS